jgi:hypothetical protein
MKTFFVGSLLALCLVLIDGYDQLLADACENSVRDSSINVADIVAHVCNDTEQTAFLQYNFAGPNGQKPVFAIEITEPREREDGDHESITFKKLKSGDYFAAILCACTLSYFSSYLREVLAFRRHFPYISSHKQYLILRVFRI